MDGMHQIWFNVHFDFNLNVFVVVCCFRVFCRGMFVVSVYFVN